MIVLVALLLVAASATQIEFNLTAVLQQGQKRTLRIGQIAAEGAGNEDKTIGGARIAKRQQAPSGSPTPCGGHDYLPPVALCTPSRLAPTNVALVPNNNRVLVVGSRGVSFEVCEQSLALGKRVTCTTIERNAVLRQVRGLQPGAQLSAGIKLRELDLGLDGTVSLKSPSRFARRYMREEDGYLPDEIYVIGQNVNGGNPEDYDEEERQYNTRMYQTGWRTLLFELQKYARFPQNVNRSVQVVFLRSAGSNAITPGVLDDYYTGAKATKDFTRHRNVLKLPGLERWRYAMLEAFFIKTQYYLSQRNPSADRGDPAQQEYLNFTIMMTNAVGNLPSDAGRALIQIAQLPPGSATHWQLLPGQLPGAFIDWSAGSFRTLENNLDDPLYTIYSTGGMASLQIHINQHANYTPPFYDFESNDWK